MDNITAYVQWLREQNSNDDSDILRSDVYIPNGKEFHEFFEKAEKREIREANRLMFPEFFKGEQ